VADLTSADEQEPDGDLAGSDGGGAPLTPEQQAALTDLFAEKLRLGGGCSNRDELHQQRPPPALPFGRKGEEGRFVTHRARHTASSGEHVATEGFLLRTTVLAAALLSTSCAPNQGRFLLVNKAGELIARASVDICDQTFAFSNLAPNGSTSGSYIINSDGYYNIQVEFASGTRLHEETGYVTNGRNFLHEIVVTQSGIELSGSPDT
jgi:hypothetical protein